MKNYIIQSVENYVGYISEINKTLNADFGYREYCVYRGHANASWELMPGIARSNKGNASLLDYEAGLIDMANNYFPEETANKRPIDLLAYLQHYGLPTRLLDVSENPLIALYFTVSDLNDTDGEVIAFRDIDTGKSYSTSLEAIADLSRIMRNGELSIDSFIEMVQKRSYYINDGSIFAIKKGEDDWIHDDLISRISGKAFVVFAGYLSKRQLAQKGAYILFNNTNDGKTIHREIKKINKNDSSIKARFVIPCNCKKKIKKELEILGIDKQTLFPDSKEFAFEKIAEHFKSLYNEF